MRIIYLDMRSTSQTCESASVLHVGFEYSEVCGRAVGYQLVAFAHSSGRPIEGYYMDGLTLTYGWFQNACMSMGRNLLPYSYIHVQCM